MPRRCCSRCWRGGAFGIAHRIEHAYVVPALVSASKDARMVVVGSRGLGAFGRAVLGSTSSGLLHHAHCPVAMIHTDEAQAADRTSPILLGIDGTPASEAATALAFEEASRRKSILWRCMRGAMSVSSPLWVCTGRSTKTKDMKCLANAWLVGRSSIRT